MTSTGPNDLTQEEGKSARLALEVALARERQHAIDNAPNRAERRRLQRTKGWPA